MEVSFDESANSSLFYACWDAQTVNYAPNQSSSEPYPSPESAFTTFPAQAYMEYIPTADSFGNYAIPKSLERQFQSDDYIPTAISIGDMPPAILPAYSSIVYPFPSYSANVDGESSEVETTPAILPAAPLIMENNQTGATPKKKSNPKSTKNRHDKKSFRHPRPRIISSDKSEKPPHTYISLIARAIQAQPSKKATLAEIYQYLRDNHEFFRGKYVGWKNSIRHNLSIGGCFKKLPKTNTKSNNGEKKVGKGHQWAIGPELTFDSKQQRRCRLLDEEDSRVPVELGASNSTPKKSVTSGCYASSLPPTTEKLSGKSKNSYRKSAKRPNKAENAIKSKNASGKSDLNATPDAQSAMPAFESRLLEPLSAKNEFDGGISFETQFFQHNTIGDYYMPTTANNLFYDNINNTYCSYSNSYPTTITTVSTLDNAAFPNTENLSSPLTITGESYQILNWQIDANRDKLMASDVSQSSINFEVPSVGVQPFTEPSSILSSVEFPLTINNLSPYSSDAKSMNVVLGSHSHYHYS